MTLTCPVCKVERNTGETCRRCKADLRLVRAVRLRLQREACEVLLRRDFAAAYRLASRVRP
jgi:hypothetical protein